LLTLTLVRHASTVLNEQRRYQGWTDPPLSACGRREARLLGERIATAHFDALVSSDSRRCVETAALALPERTIATDRRWRELDFGAWDGRTYAECEASQPDLLRAWIGDPAGVTPPGGEPFAGFCRRVDGAVDALPREGQALLIAHGGPIRRVLAAALGLQWRQVALMQISACGITRVALHPTGGHLLTLNDTAHLEG
jgi:broad specificity phosphatase PhoE